jgi:hypothetical protein
MPQADRNRPTHRLTRRTYSLTSRDNSKKADALCAPPMSERDIREQLAKARIALDHEVATRLVMEQQASESLAEIHRMRTDLTFLKRQRDRSN